MNKRLVILLSSGCWEELDEHIELVLCEPADLMEAQRVGRPPDGTRINVVKQLRWLLELLEP